MSFISLSRGAAVSTSHFLLSSMVTPMFTKRFGGLSALKIGSIYIVWFGLKGKWKFSFHAPKGVETANGISDLTALNLGRFLVMREVVRIPPRGGRRTAP